MMVGPCLCGDLYCGSCGNPAHAALEEAEIALMDILNDNQATLGHYQILIAIIPTFIEAVNKAVGEAVQDFRTGDLEYISYLKDRIFELRGEVTPDIED
jgi:hypothetical protein